MSKPHQSGRKQVKVTIDTSVLLGSLQVSLQRLMDMVAIGFAGAPKVQEDDYKQSPSFTSFHVAANNRTPLPQAKEDFSAWCLKNSFIEAIDFVSAFLEDCRLIAGIYALGSQCKGTDWNRLNNVEKKAFHRMGFPDKIEHLRKHLRASSKFEQHVLSLNRARNCLVHRLGFVSSKDVDPSGRLTIRWHAFELLVVNDGNKEERILSEPTTVEAGTTLQCRTRTVEKQFQVGDRIRFSLIEHNHTMFTFFVFALELVQAIEKLQPRPASSNVTQEG